MNTYNYYIKIIKPIEKKYTRLCIWNSILKSKKLEKKKHFYNKILINYYKMLQNNYKELEILENVIYANGVAILPKD